jgi:hypothetical protein
MSSSEDAIPEALGAGSDLLRGGTGFATEPTDVANAAAAACGVAEGLHKFVEGDEPQANAHTTQSTDNSGSSS